MKKNPKRILFCSEATYLTTGYATLTHELMSRLFKTDKYELAELATYGDTSNPQDSRWLDIPWRFYPVMPNKNLQNEVNKYNSDMRFQFGSWKFEETVLDFKAQYVASCRDHWQDSFINQSPFKRFFKTARMPAIDAEPLQDDWVEQALKDDALFGYSKFAIDALNKRGNINTREVAPPGVDLETFRPFPDKKAHKQNLGVDPNTFIVGMVARNQRRKLFPDLMEAFNIFLKKANPEIAKKTYLYLHTSYPDIGWNIPQLLKESGLGHKTLFTYSCKSCQASFPSFFNDALTFCRNCGQLTATFPNFEVGVSRQSLAQIYNLFDAYVQYANCFAKGTEILCKNGWNNIENVKIGDLVWTHNGKWQKVVNTFINPANKCLEIKVWGDYESLIVSKEHPFLSITKNNTKEIAGQSLRETIGYIIRNKQELPKPSFIHVGSLKCGDLILYRINDEIQDLEHIDLGPIGDWNNEDFFFVKHGSYYPRKIIVDNNFCRFIGLFAGDGSSSDKTKSISVCCHKNQSKQRKICEIEMKRILNEDPKCYEYKKRNAVNYVGSSRAHNKIFYSWFSKKENKSLPDWCMLLPTGKQLKILEGLFLADGHYLGNKNVSIYCTISRKLANQIKDILRRCRLDFNVRVITNNRKDGKLRKNQFRFEVPGNVSEGNFIFERSSSSNLYIDNYHCLKIKKIENSDYNNNLYNIEVEEDNSYTTKISSVHNCEGFGIPQAEAASCGIPVFATDYSAMSDVVRKLKGFPIKVKHFNREIETHRKMAVPDPDDFADQLNKFLSLPEPVRSRKCYESRKGAETHYDWDKIVKIWENYFDNESLPEHDYISSPAYIHIPAASVPNNLSNANFVRWGIYNIGGRQDLVNSYLCLRIIRDLNLGFTQDGSTFRQFTRDNVVKYFLNMCELNNNWERKRTEK